MGDMGDLYNDLREHNRQRKQGNLTAFQGSELQARMTRHTEHHYSIMLAGSKLDYWPSTRRWRWKNRTTNGTPQDLQNFITKRQAEDV